MAAVAKQYCVTSGHDGYHPVAIPEASNNVFVNGVGACRVGDNSITHTRPNSSPHTVTISTGSSTVFVNGKALAHEGSSTGCGDTIVSACSPNVQVGG